MLRLTSDIINGLPAYIRVGVIRYSNQADIVFNIAGSDQRENLISAIENLEYIGGRTGTDLGIHRAISLFTKGKDVQRIVLVMTDGKSNDLLSSISAAESAKREYNVQLYCVAIGKDINEKELKMLVSKPSSEYIHEIKNINDDMHHVITRLHSSIRKG